MLSLYELLYKREDEGILLKSDCCFFFMKGLLFNFYVVFFNLKHTVF